MYCVSQCVHDNMLCVREREREMKRKRERETKRKGGGMYTKTAIAAIRRNLKDELYGELK